jgi:hypothetical protein
MEIAASVEEAADELRAEHEDASGWWDTFKHWLLMSIFPVVGISVLVMCYLVNAHTQAFLARAQKAQGTVVSSGTRYAKPLFRFIDRAGNEQSMYIHAENGFSHYKKGETETVLYVLDGSDEAMLDTFSCKYGFVFAFVCMGTVFLGAGLMMLLLTYSDAVATRYRKLFWIRTEAWLQTVEKSKKPRHDGNYAYRFIAARLHPKTKRMRTYKSEFLYIDPRDYVGLDSLTVYIARGKSEKYHVEIPAPQHGGLL